MIPLLSQIPLDSSLFKKDTSHMGPPDTQDRMDTSENGDGSKENIDPLLQDLQVTACQTFVSCQHMFLYHRTRCLSPRPW